MLHRTSSSCTLCGTSASEPLESRDRHGAPLAIVICKGCGVVRNDPIPTADELELFYAKQYRSEYKRTRQPRLRHAARYLPAVSRHIVDCWKHYQKANRILDIGSGSGEFLYLMKSLGKSVRGIEPSHDYSAFCRDCLGLDVTTGSLASFPADAAFDHIRLCHVVEHLRDPLASLRAAAGLLAPGGTIYVEVPDFDKYCRTKSPGSMFHYGHIYNFDHETFEFMAAAAGFRIHARTGPTSAFLRPDPVTPPPSLAAADVLKEKLELYALHRKGALRSQPAAAKLAARIRKSIREHLIITCHRSHLAIARHVAEELRNAVPCGPPTGHA